MSPSPLPSPHCRRSRLPRGDVGRGKYLNCDTVSEGQAIHPPAELRGILARFDKNTKGSISMSRPFSPLLILPDRLVMLSQGGGEVMGTIVAGDEVEILHRRGIEGCQEG